MTVQLIPYMTAAVAVHALLLSLGGLMVINSLRALARLEEQIWESEPEEEKAAYAGIFQSPPRARIGILQNEMPWLMKANLALGSVGVLYSLAVIASSPESPSPSLLATFSLILVILQIFVFVVITLRAMDYLRSWIKKFPQQRP